MLKHFDFGFYLANLDRITLKKRFFLFTSQRCSPAILGNYFTMIGGFLLISCFVGLHRDKNIGNSSSAGTSTNGTKSSLRSGMFKDRKTSPSAIINGAYVARRGTDGYAIIGGVDGAHQLERHRRSRSRPAWGNTPASGNGGC
jgi:hypothetical protein